MSIATSVLVEATNIRDVHLLSKARARSEGSDNRRKTYWFDDNSRLHVRGYTVTVVQADRIERPAVAPEQRQCSDPECWLCNGTGLDNNGQVCTWNDELPF